MIRSLYVVYLLMIITSCHCACGLFSWLFSRNKVPTSDNKPSTEAAQARLPSAVPFEMTTVDDEFALQAEFIKHLSPLDACHHRTIAEIQGTCGDLSEEELGKLAVQLLNCQLHAEKRSMYPCTQAMTLAECTQDMDSTVWNAYQIVSNRARAVCYSARQQQFRAKTEMTVNALVHTTRDQLDAMKHIQMNQVELKDQTENTLRGVKEGQERLVASQSHIQQAQSLIHGHVSANLQALMREKALIATGNKDLAEMTQAIKQKLDATSEQLEQQEVHQKANHKEILQDLAAIQQRAKQVWSKIDESSQKVLQYHGETRKNYQETLDNLARINATVAGVTKVLAELRGWLEERLSWLMSVVGTTGDHMTMLWTLLLHASYLLLAAVSASFLHTPIFSRLILLVIVPLNAWVMIGGHGPALGYLSMTMLILLTVIGNWSVHWVLYVCHWYKSRTQQQLTASFPQKAICSLDSSMQDASMCSNLNDTVPYDHAPNEPIASGCTPNISHSLNSPCRAGLTTPDFKKLISVLEKIYNSGVLSPGTVPTSPLVTSDKPHLKKKVSCMDTDKATPEQRFTMLSSNPKPSPITEPLSTAPPRPLTPSVELVRRDLLQAMSADTRIRQRDSSPEPRKKQTESLSASLLDEDLSVRNSPRGSRSSTPVRMAARPVCLSTTRAGRACRLSSLEGSAFCHLHQVSS